MLTDVRTIISEQLGTDLDKVRFGAGQPQPCACASDSHSPDVPSIVRRLPPAPSSLTWARTPSTP